MNRNAAIIIIVLLLLVSVAVGLVGYYSEGWQNWERFGAEQSETLDSDETPEPENPAEYTPIEVGDVVTRLYFNKNFDLVSFFEERFPEGMKSEQSYLRIKTEDIRLTVVYYEKTLFIVNESSNPVPIYCSEDIDSGVGLWQKGWAMENDYIDLSEIGECLRITEIRGQNLFKYFISTDGVFAQ